MTKKSIIVLSKWPHKKVAPPILNDALTSPLVAPSAMLTNGFMKSSIIALTNLEIAPPSINPN